MDQRTARVGKNNRAQVVTIPLGTTRKFALT